MENGSFSSQFLSLIQRNISCEIFFDCLLSEKDLSILLGTCREMKVAIIRWKSVLPIQKIDFHKIRNLQLENLIKNYSSKIIILNLCEENFTKKGYKLLSHLNSNNLLQLQFKMSYNRFAGFGLCTISSVFSNLISLSLEYCYMMSCYDLDSISKLTNLENLFLIRILNLNDVAVSNYSTLTKLKSLEVSEINVTHVGFLANKVLLVSLEIHNCTSIGSNGGFHCLTTLTNLTHLKFFQCFLDNATLNMICSSCLLIEHLTIGAIIVDLNLDLISKEGLNSIHYLSNLKSLSLGYDSVRDDWLAMITNNFSLTSLTLSQTSFTTITNPGLYQLSSLTSLTSIKVYSGRGGGVFGREGDGSLREILAARLWLSKI
jgi:hypothetical protein